MHRPFLLTAAFLATAAVSQAGTFVFEPTPKDLGDLSHQNAYSWGIDWRLQAGYKITSAQITIKNVWDWKVERDSLFIDLLDDPAKGVKSFADNSNDNVRSDYFTESSTLKNWESLTHLTTWEDPFGGKQRWFTFTYDFNAAQLAALTAYTTDNPFQQKQVKQKVSGTGIWKYGVWIPPQYQAVWVNDTAAHADFGLTFDPDCHYYNDGIKLVITTTPVPDSATTALMLGAGLIGLAALRRRLIG